MIGAILDRVIAIGRGVGSTIGSAIGKLPRSAKLGAAGLVAVLLLAVAVGLVGASRPAFLGHYAELEGNVKNLEASVHHDVPCAGCHVDDRGPLVAEAALVGDFYRGIVDRPDSPAYIELPRPTNDACLECHYEDWSHESSRTVRVPHPAHLRTASETRECVECHKWTAHEEEYIERHKTMPFSRVCASFGCHAGTKPIESCGDCHHVLKEDAGDWGTLHKETVQQAGPNGCLEACHDAEQCRQCHTTGERPDFPDVTTNEAVQQIELEHVKPEWMESHGDLAFDDDSKCFVCHVSVGECENCHKDRPDSHGLESTWLNRHKDVVEDEQRCYTCHDADWCEDCHEQFEEMG